MPFDGIVLSGAVWEINGLLEGGRIERVFQTGRYEITLQCHSHGEKFRLLISANPENPRIHLTKSKKENPLIAPPFAMVLRKHIQSGKIISLTQEGYDRIVTLTVETHNEMGDVVNKKLIAEIMGKYSNIILTSASGTIFDSIKRVDEDMSSVREVMPGRIYMLPPQQDKIKPEEFKELAATAEDMAVSKLILNTISGFSPMLCKAICSNAGVPHSKKYNELTQCEIAALNDAIKNCCRDIYEKKFSPAILDGGKDFHCTETVLKATEITAATGVKKYNTVNLMLDDFYTKKDNDDRLRQKQNSVKKHVKAAMEKCKRKIQIHSNTAEETAEYEKYKQFGEILTANMYKCGEYEEKVIAINYYEESMPEVTIELDKNKTVSQNAQNFFQKYRKNKTANESAEKYLEECISEMEYLESVETMLENNTDLSEIEEIKEELTEQGYIKQEKTNKKNKNGKNSTNGAVSAPHEYLTQDGYTILIGKNNLQNEKLTCKIAKPDDVWFHLKNAPGSHVILKTAEHGGQITKHSVECAAALAAWYSSARNTSKADVDYTRVKHVKKQPGGRPGMVIYVNYKTITINPSETPEG